MNALAELLGQSFKVHAQRICAVAADGSMVTYETVWERAVNMAKLLKNGNADCRRHVGLYLHNGPEFVSAYLAVLLSDSVPVLLPMALRSWDLKRALDFCDVESVICPADVVDRIGGAKTSLHCGNNTQVLKLDAAEVETIPGSPRGDTLTVLMPTSGSTGSFKAVALTDHGIIENVRMYCEDLKLGPDDGCLVLLPLTSASAHTTQMIAHLTLGARLVFADRMFLPQRFLRLVMERKPSVVSLVPSLFRQVLTKGISTSGLSLKMIVVSGAPLPGDLIQVAREKWPDVNIVNAYGLTETGPRVSHFVFGKGERPAGSVGRPFKGIHIRILREDGFEAETGECGEVVIQSPSNMLGYYRNTALTRSTLRDGWLFTGDLGSMDTGGYLYIRGRKKNMICKGGIKVQPEEIEEFLSLIPEVEEALVFAEPDILYGERIIAHVVPRNGCSVDIGAVMSRCRNSLSPMKVPDGIEIVSQLPKTTNGKLQRRYTESLLADQAKHAV